MRKTARERTVVALDVLVAVPIPAREPVVVAAPDLHKPHAAFQQPAGRQALASEDINFLRSVDLLRPVFHVIADAVHLQHPRGLLGNIERFGRGELHLRREFIAADATLQPLIAGASQCMRTIERRK